MKVCHFTSVHSPLDVRIYLKECVSLAKAGFETHLVVTGYKNVESQGVHIHSVEKKASRLKRMLITSWRVYRQAKKLEASVYHFHDPELLPYALLLSLQGKHVIYDVHEDVPRDIMSKEWIPKPIRKAVAFIAETIENFIAKRCVVIGATPAITARFQKLGCKAVNVNNYPILSELFPTIQEWSIKCKQVCYVGGINQVRGIDQMVEAAYEAGVRLVLAGLFTNDEHRKQLSQSPKWNNVKELGQIDRQGIKELYDDSIAGLVVLQPIDSFKESLPIKMFEYMSAGIPVIASDFKLWKTIIEGNHCGICVDPSDVKAIADAINWFKEHPKEAEQMGKNGRLAIEQQYNWEIESKKLIELYKGLENENLDF